MNNEYTHPLETVSSTYEYESFFEGKHKIKVDPKEIAEPDYCEECGLPLPVPVMEVRARGQLEMVTYCPCGATYTS